MKIVFTKKLACGECEVQIAKNEETKLYGIKLIFGHSEDEICGNYLIARTKFEKQRR